MRNNIKIWIKLEKYWKTVNPSKIMNNNHRVIFKNCALYKILAKLSKKIKANKKIEKHYKTSKIIY